MSKWIRQIHRWLSIAFTLTVIANFVAIGMGKQENPPGLLTYSPLFPLALLMLTGLYMFVLPYAARRRARQSERFREGAVAGGVGGGNGEGEVGEVGSDAVEDAGGLARGCDGDRGHGRDDGCRPGGARMRQRTRSGVTDRFKRRAHPTPDPGHAIAQPLVDIHPRRTAASCPASPPCTAACPCTATQPAPWHADPSPHSPTPSRPPLTSAHTAVPRSTSLTNNPPSVRSGPASTSPQPRSIRDPFTHFQSTLKQ